MTSLSLLGKGSKIEGGKWVILEKGAAEKTEEIRKTGDIIYGWPLIRFLSLLLELKSH